MCRECVSRSCLLLFDVQLHISMSIFMSYHSLLQETITMVQCHIRLKLCFNVSISILGYYLNLKSTNAQKQAVRRKRWFVASCISECNHCSMLHYCQSFSFTAYVFKIMFKARNILYANTQTRMQFRTYLTYINCVALSTYLQMSVVKPDLAS